MPRPARRRDALRLRVRWVQELQCRTVTVLAGRLAPRLAAVVPATAASGPVDAVELVAHLGLDELQSLVAGHEPPGDLASRLVSVPQEWLSSSAYFPANHSAMRPTLGTLKTSVICTGTGSSFGVVTRVKVTPSVVR